jgi:hypothetical protein
MAEVKLNREAATALVKEARFQLENAAEQVWGSTPDESQRPDIDASAEVIGRMRWTIEVGWPQEQTPVGSIDQGLVEFEFTPETLKWLSGLCSHQERHVAEVDAGDTEPGYNAEAVYLLHVLRLVELQAIHGAAA